MKSYLLFIITSLLMFTAEATPRMDAMVVHFDLNGDGSLSVSELRDLTHSLGEMFEPDSPPETALQSPSEDDGNYVENEIEELPSERELHKQKVEEARQVALDWSDKDDNQKISREEKQKIVEALRGETKGAQLGSKDTVIIDTFFLAFDQDGSDALSTQERLNAVDFILNHYKKTPEEFAELQDKCIKYVDENNDWRLSVEEKNRASELLRGSRKDKDISDELIFAFDSNENETLSTVERNRAMELIEEYFRPFPLETIERSKGESSDAPFDYELDIEDIAEGFLRYYDADESQSLNLSELVAALRQGQVDGLFRTSLLTVESLRASRISKIRTFRAELMLFFDKDSNGFLSKDETDLARDALRGKIAGERVGENNDAMVEQIITAFDIDGSGTISVEERVNAMKSIVLHFQPVPLEADEEKTKKKKKNRRK